MRCAPRLLSACLAVLALLGAGAATAAAQEAGDSVAVQIFADYAENRVIDGHYSSSDLRAALEIAQANGAGFEEFGAAVQETWDRDILGLSVDATPQPATGSDRSGGLLTLPEPRGPGERDQPPWPFLALSALAAALVVTGAGSSILRRVRR